MGRTSGVWIALCLVVALLLGGLRLVHLDADTPLRASQSGDGLYVDEGYKTLMPRNLVQHGALRWAQGDDYPGWMRMSPITQWAFYASFRTLGVSVESARVISIAFFLGLLLCCVLGLAGRLGPGLLVLGVLALGLESTLFYFSRVALFEAPLAFGMVATLLLVAWIGDRRPVPTCALVLAMAAVLTLGVKATAALFVFPIVLGVIGASLWRSRAEGRDPTAVLRRPAVLVLVPAVIGALLWLTAPIWNGRVSLRPDGVIDRLLLTPLAPAAAFLLLGGLLAALHGPWCRPAAYLGSSYRLSLLGITLGIPVALSFFEYNPLRYYVPAIPAYVLLILEWLKLRGPDDEVPQVPSWARWLVLAPVLILAAFWGLRALNDAFLTRLPLDLGAEPGIGGRALLRIGLLPCLVFAIAAVIAWRRWMHRGFVRIAAVSLACAFVSHQGLELGSFLTHPSFTAREFRQQLVSTLPEGATIGGEYAVFLTLGTSLRALHMNRIHNRADDGNPIEVDYYLWARSVDATFALDLLRARSDLELEGPILRGEYNRTPLELYRLVRRSSAAGGSGP